jgi:hypothetical protein
LPKACLQRLFQGFSCLALLRHGNNFTFTSHRLVNFAPMQHVQRNNRPLNLSDHAPLFFWNPHVHPRACYTRHPRLTHVYCFGDTSQSYCHTPPICL